MTRPPPSQPSGVEIAIEGTYAFNSSDGFSKHIEANAKQILFAPGKNCPTYLCCVSKDIASP